MMEGSIIVKALRSFVGVWSPSGCFVSVATRLVELVSQLLEPWLLRECRRLIVFVARAFDGLLASLKCYKSKMNVEHMMSLHVWG